MRLYTCKLCQEKLPASHFRTHASKFIKKDGTVSQYRHPRHYCRECEAKKATQQRLMNEFERGTKGYHSGTAISIRTLLTMVKRRMRTAETFEQGQVWASVGLELNNLLIRTF